MALNNIKLTKEQLKVTDILAETETLVDLRRCKDGLGIGRYSAIIEAEINKRINVLKSTPWWTEDDVVGDLKEKMDMQPNKTEVEYILPPAYQKTNPEGAELRENFLKMDIHQKIKTISNAKIWGISEADANVAKSYLRKQPLFDALKFLDSIVRNYEQTLGKQLKKR